MDWMAEGRRRAQARLKSLADSSPAFSIPIHDSPETAPGWRFITEIYSCIPDAAYPWDPAIVRAIREFCPDAQPISIRTVWKSSALDGNVQTMVLLRHGIARAVRDPIAPIHSFYCHMPSTPRSIHLSRPNYIEVNWYDKQIRPWGYDLPGAYLPFDWEFYKSLRTAYIDNLLPEELSDHLVNPFIARRELRRKQIREEQEYIDRDVQSYQQRRLDRASDQELAELAAGVVEPESPPAVSVPHSYPGGS